MTNLEAIETLVADYSDTTFRVRANGVVVVTAADGTIAWQLLAELKSYGEVHYHEERDFERDDNDFFQLELTIAN